jgi:hypothetical protein
LTGAKVTIFASSHEDGLHSEAEPFSFKLSWVVTVHFIDDGLEVGWLHRSRSANYIFCVFFKSKDGRGGMGPLRVVEIPFLIAEFGLYLIEALVAWRIVKTNRTKFEGVICNIEFN